MSLAERPSNGERYRFGSEHQRAAVCRRLLGAVGLSHLWTQEGPKSTAWRPLLADAALPTFEMLFVLAAWHVWIDDDLTRLAPAFEMLDPRLSIGVCALDGILRATPAAIDAWIAAGTLTFDGRRPGRTPRGIMPRRT